MGEAVEGFQHIRYYCGKAVHFFRLIELGNVVGERREDWMRRPSQGVKHVAAGHDVGVCLGRNGLGVRWLAG